ncbi:hypothetical protein HON58_04025 [Candidatus Peregrinibacteria bacterium]|jgi:hypothetical protein|nr:hypothetical protein [Candidatus Peregrinibacteria bacterium]
MATNGGDSSPEELNLHKLVENPRGYLEELDRSGKLAQYFPAFAETKGVTQSPDRHAEGDVFIHTLLTLDQIKKESPSDRAFGSIEDEHDLLLITLALIYHDTGKKERNLHDTPDHRVFHVNESVKHARADLASYLSEDDLETVIEMINKHENLLDSKHTSHRINKLHKLLALKGDTKRGRILLKFAECDLYGRRVSESHKHLLEKGGRLAERNIELLRLLQQQEAEGLSFPLQRVATDVQSRVKALLDSCS